MNFKKVIAIFRSDSCGKVERRLQEIGVHGFSISKVKCYGEYADLFSSDWLVTHARIEIFAEQSKVEEIVEIITETAHVGREGDGIIAVQPVEKLHIIRTRSEVSSGEVY